MEEKRPMHKRLLAWLAKLFGIIALYLDDLLLVSGGSCFVWAAWHALGRAAGVAVAGVWLCILAVLVARSRRGGDR